MKEFELVVSQYYDRILEKVRRMVNSPEDAEDITQETFFRACRGWPDFRKESNVYTWLYCIATNLVKNLYARNKKLPKFVPLDVCKDQLAIPTAYDEYVPKESLEKIEKAVNSVKPFYRDIVLLQAYENKTYEEISEIVGCKPNTLKSRFSRARKAVQAQLELSF